MASWQSNSATKLASYVIEWRCSGWRVNKAPDDDPVTEDEDDEGSRGRATSSDIRDKEACGKASKCAELVGVILN